MSLHARFGRMVDAFRPAEGPPPRTLLAFFRWCLSGAWPGLGFAGFASALGGAADVVSAMLLGLVVDAVTGSAPGQLGDRGGAAVAAGAAPGEPAGHPARDGGALDEGKQEVEAALLGKASVFTDEVAQSVTIGEAQHAVAQGLIAPDDITQIGAVINGDRPGRVSDDQITLFDGTGVGLQDLAVASAAVDLAVERGIAIAVQI